MSMIYYKWMLEQEKIEKQNSLSKSQKNNSKELIDYKLKQAAIDYKIFWNDVETYKNSQKILTIDDSSKNLIKSKSNETWNVESIQNLISNNPKILYDIMLGQPGIDKNNIITYTPNGGVNFVEVNSDGYFRKYSKEPWGNEPNKKLYEKNSKWKTPWNYRSELFDHIDILSYLKEGDS